MPRRSGRTSRGNQHAAPPSPVEKVVRGYKVTVTWCAVSPEEAARRRSDIAKVIAESILRDRMLTNQDKAAGSPGQRKKREQQGRLRRIRSHRKK